MCVTLKIKKRSLKKESAMPRITKLNAVKTAQKIISGRGKTRMEDEEEIIDKPMTESAEKDQKVILTSFLFPPLRK